VVPNPGNRVVLNRGNSALLDNGILMEMQKDKLVSLYSEHGKAYRIVAMPE